MTLRARSFPTLEPEAVVYEDERVIVIDKPAFVPTQASRPGATDDLPARLTAFLAARDGIEPYVGTHQRLDQATSGLIVYAKRPDANAWLARAFEGRLAQKTYLAAVSGARIPDQASWEDALLDVGGEDRMRVVPRGTGGSRIARSEVSVIERRGDRALVSVRIDTGRTHQIRAQLAHRGAKIAGDAWYGGAPWPRLGLASIALAVPGENAPALDVRIAPPRSLRDFVEARVRDPIDDRETAREVLRVAAERRYGLAHAEGTTCFRWVNDAADGAPTLSVDVYGEHAVLHAYDARDVRAFADVLVDRGVRGVYLKRRPQKASTLDAATTLELAPLDPIAGEATGSAEIEVRENGMPFLVRLGDGMSTGLFLDQRANRARVKGEASGARVLNLFAYTCAFSIAAASGGAIEVLSVDAAKKQLERGVRGFAHASLDASLHQTIADDAFAVLDRLARRGRTFDLVICDPPTYSSTRRSPGAGTRFTSGRMWIELATHVLRVVGRDGRVLATSNDRRLTQRDLRTSFRDAARGLGLALAQVKDLAPPIDFPALAGEAPHLKGVLVRV